MSFKKTLLAAAAVVALPVLAQAQPVSGLYIGAGAGGNLLGKTDVTGSTAADKAALGGGNWSTDFAWGYVGVLSMGWGFGNGLRAEIEGNYRRNDLERFTIDGFVAQGASGRINTYGAMVNALYDIGAVQGWPVQITLGGGVGYAWSRYDSVRGSYTTPFNATYTLNDTAGAFAYQGIVGLTLPVRSVPAFALTAEYRYFAMVAARVNGVAAATGTSVPFSIKHSNENHAVLFGVRYNFGSSPVLVSASGYGR